MTFPLAERHHLAREGPLNSATMPIKPVNVVARDRRRIVWAVAALISFAALARCVSAQAPVPAAVHSDSTQEVTHTVKTGDTLWDIARTYLKNPFRWPEIFRRNTDIVKNPHWIYPGEVIRIPLSEVRPDVLNQPGNTSVVARVATLSRRPTVFSAAPGGTRARAGGAGVTPDKYRAPGVRVGEIEGAPYLDAAGGPRGAGRIEAAVDRPAISGSADEARFQLNDKLYVSPPKGIVARLGDRYLAYVLGDEIEDHGQLLVPTAILRVESIAGGEPAVVRIIRQFGEVRLGQRLIVADPVAAVTRAPQATGALITGKVLLVHLDPVLPTLQHYVVISPSSRNGIAVGDEFALISDTMGREDPDPAPPVSAAIAQVVKVTPFGSTAIVVSQIQPVIKEGMPVRLTAKMP